MRQFRNLLSAFLVLGIAFGFCALPLQVSAKTTPAPAAATAAPAPAATDDSSTPTAAPPATPAPAATKPAAPYRAKLIDATDVSTTALSKGSIDVYMSLTNSGKLDDALVNAETQLSDKISLVTVKDKKETENASMHVDLPMGKAVKLGADDKFIRISGIEKSLKDGDKFQIILHFMRAPNVMVDVTVHKKSSFLGM